MDLKNDFSTMKNIRLYITHERHCLNAAFPTTPKTVWLKSYITVLPGCNEIVKFYTFFPSQEIAIIK